MSDSDLVEERDALRGARPTSISVVCVLVFAGVALGLPAILSDIGRSPAGSPGAVPEWMFWWVVAASLLALLFVMGLWSMLRWAAYGYTALFVLNQGAAVLAGVWGLATLPGFFLGLIAVAIVLSNLHRMV
ncbi:MAG TPA: hypothetical protein VG389_09105 [Myxococcota bacterium]|jgi:hypothetical protein|nr:hypothetical protein [Myxococcota bacterium]